jgi:hypothetical protein
VASARTVGSRAERLLEVGVVGGAAVGEDVGAVVGAARMCRTASSGLWSGCQDRHVPVLLKSC